MCAKKNNLIPKPFNKVKVISFKVTLHKLWGLVLQKYQNKDVNIWNIILLTQIVRPSYTGCHLQKSFQTNWS